MTCLRCVVTTSTRLPSRSTGRVRRRGRSRGEAACLQRRQPIPFSLILSHQLPARQSREIDTGFSARSQYMTKLGNTCSASASERGLQTSQPFLGEAFTGAKKLFPAVLGEFARPFHGP